VLEAGSTPTFGHAKRAEAARRWFKQYREEEFGLIASDFSLGLAGKLQNLNQDEQPFAACLAGLRVEGIEISPFANVLRIISRHLCGLDHPTAEEVMEAARMFTSDQSLAPCAALLAWGLDDAIKHLSEVEALTLGDDILEELRQLANRHSDKTTVLECLARALFRLLDAALKATDSNRRELLLCELRNLGAAYPSEPIIRKMFSMGLNNTLVALGDAGSLDRCELLLDELRELWTQYPSDPEVRDSFARALRNTLGQSSNPVHYESLLDELRRLYTGNPSDSTVRERFASAILECLNKPQPESRIARIIVTNCCKSLGNYQQLICPTRISDLNLQED